LSDDACALAVLLGRPDIELSGITTVADRGGRRPAYVTHCLERASRNDVPVAAGTEALTTLEIADPVTNDERYWPTTLTPRPSPPGAALDLLRGSIEEGATIVAIGNYTNLALLEVTR
jgi:purine nucleosidase